MKKIHHEVLLRSIKLLNVVLAAVCFAVCCLRSYLTPGRTWSEEVPQLLLLALFVTMYCVFGRIYEAFQISTKRISEMIYSQGLALLMSNGVLFVVLWIMLSRFPRILPMLLCYVVQLLIATLWCIGGNRLYYRIFKPKATAIIYGTRQGMEQLIHRYGLGRKYDVRLTRTVEECLEDRSMLDGMEVVFLSGIHSRERNIILKYCIARNIQVLVVPRLGDVLMSSAIPSHVFHFPMLRVDRYAATPEYLFVKRTMDILLSLIALIVLSPIMVCVAIAIHACDKGPVFYTQIRLTKDGREFRIHKFRSMRVDAERDGVARLSTGDNDDRITPIGRIIRKTRLDELPQLLDILRGDLSIVGPRPERPEIAAQYMEELPEFALRLQAKAGLTGYAQVYGKYNTEPYDKLMMDLMYISHPSLVEDFKIIMATVKILFMSESTEGVEEGQTTAAAEKTQVNI